MNLTNLPWRKSIALLGIGFWAGSLALISQTAQSRSQETIPFCFYIQTEIDVYDSPSFRANKSASYVFGDVAYATKSVPTTVWVDDGTADGNNFYEVAFTNGQIGWVPRSPEGSDFAALEDYSGFESCPAPGLYAAGSNDICFYVSQRTNLYSRSDFAFPIDANYEIGDIAYASFPFESVGVQGGTNSFILVDIYEDNKAWLPRYPEISNISNVVDYPPEDCVRP